MTFKSIVSPIAIAAAIALGTTSFAVAQDGAAPADPINVESLTPAERTQLEDWCRAQSSDVNETDEELAESNEASPDPDPSRNSDTGSDADNANPMGFTADLCAEIDMAG